MAHERGTSRRLPRGHRDTIAAARAEWLTRVMAVGPVDRPAVGSALVTLYGHAGKPPPALLWRASPVSGAQAVADLLEMAAADARARRAVGNPDDDQVLARAWAALEKDLAVALTARTLTLLQAEVAAWLAARSRPLRRAVEVAGSALLGRPPGTPLPTQMPVWRSAWHHLLSASHGQLASDRVAVHDVARRLGLLPADEHDGLLDALVALSGAGWCWLLGSIAVVCERPTVLRTDDHGRPHADDGPALVFADGTALYAWEGTLVPRQVIEAHHLSVRAILSERNIELRRLMIERYGLRRFRRDAGARLIHEDRWGRLWRLDLPADEPLTTVEVINATREPDGSLRRYELRVPPTMRTALGAVAWTFGLSPSQYARRLRRET